MNCTFCFIEIILYGFDFTLIFLSIAFYLLLYNPVSSLCRGIVSAFKIPFDDDGDKDLYKTGKTAKIIKITTPQ